VSDISFTFTWWQYALLLLALWFWPLTFVELGVVAWWWRRRTSWPARIAAVLFGALWIGSAGTHVAAFAAQAKNRADYEADLRSRQTTLMRGTVVSGIRLPAGTVVTHGSGDSNELAAVDLPSATEIHGVPLVGHAGLAYGSLDGAVTLAGNARIGEAFCSAQGTTRFAGGKLAECRLAAPSRIHGVPCTGTLDLENGVVCTLGTAYPRYGYTWRAGTKITDYGDLVWFRTGALAPSLRIFAAPLASDSEVQFNRGAIASIDLRTNPARFHGCSFDLILIESGKTAGRPTGACGLPIPAGRLFVPLPASAIGKAN
jgi:hypothetical protein